MGLCLVLFYVTISFWCGSVGSMWRVYSEPKILDGQGASEGEVW